MTHDDPATTAALPTTPSAVAYLRRVAPKPDECPVNESGEHETYGGLCHCGWSRNNAQKPGRARPPTADETRQAFVDAEAEAARDERERMASAVERGEWDDVFRPSLDQAFREGREAEARRDATDASDAKKLLATVSFFASVIKSGERWTDTCQREYDASFAAYERIDATALRAAASPPATLDEP